MKLYESDDFIDAIRAAHDFFPHLSQQFIEKDYYLTEALRTIATLYPTQVIFKGGTSLSKGWKLIKRFSEDIDLALDCNKFNPPLGANRIDQALKEIQDAVESDPRYSFLSSQNGGRSRRERGKSLTSEFNYQQNFSGINAIKNSILLEMGIRSGNYPTTEVQLSSYLAEFLSKEGRSLGAEDESQFPMLLMEFKRTFVEKLFCIHSKVAQYLKDGTPVGADARHYYDLFFLAKETEVTTMLQSDEYADIKRDCHKISKKHFFKNYFPPVNLSFSQSEALFPPDKLRNYISAEYEQQCSNLCYDYHPPWSDVEDYFEKLRAEL